MLDILFIKIVVCCACFGWCYVNKLTANYGLLDWLPQYYPKVFEVLLNCAFCVSGWCSIISVCLLFDMTEFKSYLYVINAPFCTMIMVGIIDKMLYMK